MRNGIIFQLLFGGLLSQSLKIYSPLPTFLCNVLQNNDRPTIVLFQYKENYSSLEEDRKIKTFEGLSGEFKSSLFFIRINCLLQQLFCRRLKIQRDLEVRIFTNKRMHFLKRPLNRQILEELISGELKLGFGKLIPQSIISPGRIFLLIEDWIRFARLVIEESSPHEKALYVILILFFCFLTYKTVVVFKRVIGLAKLVDQAKIK